MLISELFEFLPKPKRSASYGQQEGLFPFFTSSNEISKYVDDYDYDGEFLIIGDGGAANCKYFSGKFSASDHNYLLKPLEGTVAQCVRYFLMKNDYQILSEGFKGAGIKNVSKTYIKGINYNYNENHTQEEIVSNLRIIETAVHAKEQQLVALDELINARFIEMFGDPIHNEKKWETKQLIDACSSIVDCPHSTPSYTFENTGFMCIRTSIVKKNKILWDEIEYIPEEEFYKRIQRKKPAKGDVVYTREGAILGIAAVIDRDCDVALGQRSMLLSPDTIQCLPEFLSAAMNLDSFLENAIHGISGSASPHINVGDIKVFKMIMPPLDLQQEFVAFIRNIEKTKRVITEQILALQELLDNRMDEYFA